jgi:hypothetical protein
MQPIEINKNKLKDVSVEVETPIMASAQAVVQKTFAASNPKKVVSDKILSHVQADFYISKAPGLEGNSTEDSLETMIHYLNALPEKLKTSPVRQLIQEFELFYSMQISASQRKEFCTKNGLDFSLETVKSMQESIRSLKPGQRYIFQGGWVAEFPGIGHAIVHAIEKQEDGRYTLMTFNTGDGLPSFHEYQVDSQGYRRYKPVVMQVNIEEANILNTNHLLSLVNLLDSPLSESDSSHGSQIIYDSILPAFGGEILPPILAPNGVMRGQRSGTCSWKVLTALLKQVSDEKTYKSIKIHLRVQNLKDYVNQKIEGKIPLTESQEFHLTNDFEKVLRMLNKGNHGFSFEETDAYFAELSNLKNKKQAHSSGFPANAKIHPIIQPIQKAEACSIEMVASSEFISDVKASAKQTAPRIEISLSTACPKKEEVLPHLENWALFCEKLYANGQYNDVVFSINELIRNLPFPEAFVKEKETRDEFWGEHGKRSDEEISKLINLLAKLNELLFQCCFRLQKSHVDELTTALNTYCIQIKLLESLLNYERSFNGSSLLGLQQEFAHEAHLVHLVAAINTNAFAHDPLLRERAGRCAAFLRCGNSFEYLVDLFTFQTKHSIERIDFACKNREKLDQIRGTIKQKAFDKGCPSGEPA